MYTRRNTHPAGPGLWITEDGEYSFTHTDDVWTVMHRAAFTGTGIIGTARTLNAAFPIAARHNVTPVGHWTFVAS